VTADNGLSWVRRIGQAEGVSYLVLLGVAMPLKYLASLPEAVLGVGWIHGVLFIAYAWVVFWAYGKNRLPLRWVGWCALASLLPFGPFVIDPRLAKLPPANPDDPTPSV
jgi:integral membrane protein